jgi:hypothetical protein
MESDLSNKQNTNFRKLIITTLIALIILFCCLISVCLLGTDMLVLSNSSSIKSQPINHKPDAFVEITVDQDGCGVYRDEVMGSSDISSLTWVIADMDGFTVLERNAENEYQYRYFQSGTFSVHVQAWFNGAYHQISDEVIIHCR